MIAALKRRIGSLFSRTPRGDPATLVESPATPAAPAAASAGAPLSARPEGTGDPLSPAGTTPAGERADTQDAAGGGKRSFG